MLFIIAISVKIDLKYSKNINAAFLRQLSLGVYFKLKKNEQDLFCLTILLELYINKSVLPKAKSEKPQKMNH